MKYPLLTGPNSREEFTQLAISFSGRALDHDGLVGLGELINFTKVDQWLINNWEWIKHECTFGTIKYATHLNYVDLQGFIWCIKDPALKRLCSGMKEYQLLVERA